MATALQSSSSGCWYIMKQLILPPDVNEVTTPKEIEILTPPKSPPSTLDQASKWLEDMQHRLNLCINTRQSADVHPRTLVAFMIETMSSVIQYYRTIGDIWDSLYSKHQLRDSHITLDRVDSILSEFLIELKLNEEQEKITQIVTRSNGAQVKPSAYDEYVNANKGKVQQKGKGKGGEGKGGKQNWHMPCNYYWKPDGEHGHQCPKYHPRHQPGRCAICGSTRPYVSQRTRPAKPKAKNAEHDEDNAWQTEAEWYESHGRMKSMKLIKIRKAKARDLSQRGSLRARTLRDLLLQHRFSPTRFRTKATLENIAAHQAYLEKLQFEQNTLRSWSNMVQDQIMGEAAQVHLQSIDVLYNAASI